jgi:hypothetical protein
LTYLPVRENLTRKEEPFPYEGKFTLTKDFFRHYETLVLVKGKAPIVEYGFRLYPRLSFRRPIIVFCGRIRKKATSLCVEPWWGINQYEGEPLDLAKRKNITLLPKGQSQAFDNEVEFVS